ncbi:MAG TPA: hypothetical protein VF362_03015 [Demequinaceae bacterium]
MLADIQPGLATPIAGIRWLTEVQWAEPYTGPIPVLAETGALPLVGAPQSEVFESAGFESAVLDVPQGPVGSIWDALDETAGIPILSRAALWRRDAVERRASA